ncbi:sensor histidine kinase [Ekhidna sp. To15]|uniref:sensor histidine kinase n=1 Tax=Ekhidna sp. To15 TaxID=3395267 RepID=UPI003F525F8E
MNIRSFKTKHAFVLAILVSGLLILRQYIDYLINDYGYDFSWFAVATRITINYLLWAAIFKGLLGIAFYFQRRQTDLKNILLHITTSIMIAGAHRLIAIRLYDFVYYANTGFLRGFFTPGNKVAMSAGLFSSFLEYWVIISLIMGVSYYTRYQLQQKELNAAKLNALQMQLHPHFLFNTLNSITSLIDIDPKKAQKMLTQLGFLMREILEQDKKHLIPLKSEMEYVRAYLEIEYIRFQDRLSLDFVIDEDVNNVAMPALLLQPIIENAIKHGIAKRPEGGVISVQASRANGAKVTIEITNDYPNLNGSAKSEGYGIGTANVAKRLQQMYGEEQTFQQRKEGSKYITQITFPIQSL